MFVVKYSFTVKRGLETEFIEAWKALTKLISIHTNGQGSTLHKEKEGVYIVYAHWANEKDWINGGESLPSEALVLREIMHTTCSNIAVLHPKCIVQEL